MYDNLIEAGVGDIDNELYWSSTEKDSTNAWLQIFSTGLQLFTFKNTISLVRAVRAF
jgi:hypothetical protein